MAAARNPSRRLTLGDFSRTGAQDCANAIDLDDFSDAMRKHPRTSAADIVALVWAQYEDDGLRKHWLEQQGDFDGLDPERCYEAWASGWRNCAVAAVKQRMADLRENPRHPHLADRWVIVRVERRTIVAAKHQGDVDAAIAVAIEHARPRRGAIIDYATVSAPDARTAVATEPARWIRLNTDRRRNPAHLGLDARGGMVRNGAALAIWYCAKTTWEKDGKRRQTPLDAEDLPVSAEHAAHAFCAELQQVNGRKLSTLATECALALGRLEVPGAPAAQVQAVLDKLGLPPVTSAVPPAKWYAEFGYQCALAALGYDAELLFDMDSVGYYVQMVADANDEVSTHLREAIGGEINLLIPDFVAATDDGQTVVWGSSARVNPNRRRR